MTDQETAAVEATATAHAAVTADLQRQIDEAKETAAEAQRTSEFWAAKAKTGGTAPAATPAAEDDPDVLEAITTGGAKGFDALAKKRGFVQKDEVEQLINSKAAQLTKEQELIGRYPDLKVKDSQFFKDTAGFYGQLVKNGTPEFVAMELAAEKAELEGMRKGTIKLPGAATGQTKEEKEAARLARVNAQAGESGGRRATQSAADDDDTLSPEQIRIADAMGVPHEKYLARAKAGVKMGGLGQR